MKAMAGLFFCLVLTLPPGLAMGQARSMGINSAVMKAMTSPYLPKTLPARSFGNPDRYKNQVPGRDYGGGLGLSGGSSSGGGGGGGTTGSLSNDITAITKKEAKEQRKKGCALSENDKMMLSIYRLELDRYSMKYGLKFGDYYKEASVDCPRKLLLELRDMVNKLKKTYASVKRNAPVLNK